MGIRKTAGWRDDVRLSILDNEPDKLRYRRQQFRRKRACGICFCDNGTLREKAPRLDQALHYGPTGGRKDSRLRLTN